MNSLITNAIRDKRLLQFSYADSAGKVHQRLVEPYAYGVTKQGHEALRCYQVGGSSESGLPAWKLFLVARMSDLLVTDRTFAGNAPGYAHGDKGLNPLYCYVP
jgi:predicted DNA-binding transcriptional regulator YafY